MSNIFLICWQLLHIELMLSESCCWDLFSELFLAVLSLVSCNHGSDYYFPRFIALPLLQNMYLHSCETLFYPVTIFCQVLLEFCAIDGSFDHLRISQTNIQHSIGKCVPRVHTKPAFSYWLQKCKSRWEGPYAMSLQDHAFVQGFKNMTSAIWFNITARKFSTKANALILTSFHGAKENQIMSM